MHPDVFTVMKITTIAVVLLWLSFCGGPRKGQSWGEALSIPDLFNAHTSPQGSSVVATVAAFPGRSRDPGL